jgi:hypothetical protein
MNDLERVEREVRSEIVGILDQLDLAFPSLNPGTLEVAIVAETIRQCGPPEDVRSKNHMHRTIGAVSRAPRLPVKPSRRLSSTTVAPRASATTPADQERTPP